MKLSRIATALAAAGLFSAAGSVSAAEAFQFNPYGNGVGVGLINSAFTIDQAPGSTVALNGVNMNAPGNSLPVGAVITNYYQANLNSILGAGSTNLFTNGIGGNYFTFVATYTETVTAAAGQISGFTINSGTFKMCAQSALGNDLAGTGFGCAGNGILSGSITGGNANVGGTSQRGNLDNFGNNDWAGTTTILSSGGATVEAILNYVDANYFPDLDVAGFIELLLTNSSLVTPFSQVDPSKRFSSDLVTDTYAANVGAINGISGPDFLFQADANTSFSRQQVPEPVTLALVGMALLGLASTSRRRLKK